MEPKVKLTPMLIFGIALIISSLIVSQGMKEFGKSLEQAGANAKPYSLSIPSNLQISSTLNNDQPIKIQLENKDKVLTKASDACVKASSTVKGTGAKEKIKLIDSKTVFQQENYYDLILTWSNGKTKLIRVPVDSKRTAYSGPYKVDEFNGE